MKRRDFLRASAGVSLASLLSCGNPTGSDRKEPSSGGSGNSNNSGNSGGNSYNYIPSVNNPPVPEIDYYLEVDNNSSNGDLGAFDKGKIFSVRAETSGHQGIEGLRGYFYRDRIDGDNFFTIVDPQGRYMPNIYVPGTSSQNPNNSMKPSAYEMTLMNRIEDRATIYSNLFFDKVTNVLPTWDPNKSDDIPGYFYAGDLSFNDLKNMNSVLQKASLAITFAFPNPYTATAFSFFTKAGGVLDNVDKFIGFVNGLNRDFDILPQKIDVNQDYSFYFPVPGKRESEMPTAIVVPAYSLKSDSTNIKNLFPLINGNSWTFDVDGFETSINVSGYKKVGGKNLVKCVSSGIEEFLGFYGGDLRYYGFNLPGIGEFYLDPPIKMGDSNIRVGRSFETNSKIVSLNNSGLSGTVRETFSFYDRRNVICNNRPFGNCWVVSEDAYFSFSRNGEEINISKNTERFFSNNVGPVRVYSEGSTFNLSGIYSAKVSPVSKSLLSLPNFVSDMIKRESY
jgi:hypothetical protein